MSEVITDKLTGRATAGDVTITSEGGSATMQLQQGVAKAWNRYQTQNTPSVANSFNIASLTDNGTGNITSHFTNNTSNANNPAPAIASSMNTVHQSETTGYVAIKHYSSTHAASDVSRAMVTVHGDLA